MLQRNVNWGMKKVEALEELIFFPIIRQQADLRSVIQANETAALLWDFLETPATRDQLDVRLAQEMDRFSEVPVGWRKDFLACLDEFLALKVIEEAEV